MSTLDQQENGNENEKRNIKARYAVIKSKDEIESCGNVGKTESEKHESAVKDMKMTRRD